MWFTSRRWSGTALVKICVLHTEAFGSVCVASYTFLVSSNTSALIAEALAQDPHRSHSINPGGRSFGMLRAPEDSAQRLVDSRKG